MLQPDAALPVLSSPTQIIIRIKAISLNARDIQIATNAYPAPHAIPNDLVPVSGARADRRPRSVERAVELTGLDPPFMEQMALERLYRSERMSLAFKWGTRRALCSHRDIIS